MKKFVFTFAILCLTWFGQSQACGFEVEHSKILSFTHQLVGTSKIFPIIDSLKETAWNLRNDNKPDLKAKLETVHNYLKACSKLEKHLHDFEIEIYRIALEAKNLPTFVENLDKRYSAAGPFPAKAFEELFDQFCESFYFDESEINKTMSVLSKELDSKNFHQLLESQKNFFKIPEQNLKIRIVGIPLLASKEEFQKVKATGKSAIYGLNLDNVQLIEVPIIIGMPEITLKAGSHLLAVALHEISHYLFNLSKTNKAAKAFFYNSPLPNARYAWAFFNESLATAMGNGYVDTLFQLNDPQWYNNPVINKMGHRLYPILKEYLDKKYRIDDDFYRQFIKDFKQEFPNPQSIPEVALTRWSLEVTGLDLEQVKVNLSEILKERVPQFDYVESDSASSTSRIEIQAILKEAFLIQKKLVRKKEKADHLETNKSAAIYNQAKRPGSQAIFFTGALSGNSELVLLLESKKDLQQLFAKVMNQKEFSPIRIIDLR